MKRILICLALGATLVAVFPAARAEEKPRDPVQLTRAVLPALVRVEYQLQFDKADVPEGGLGNERCPNCGQYHGDQLRTYLQEERPVETAGFLVAPNRVVTVDPLIHPRFIKSITVRFHDQSATATIAGYARDRKAVVLSLAATLPGASPLKFATKSDGELYVVSYARESGLWVAAVLPFPKQATVPDGEPPYVLSLLRGVAVKADGAPVGILLSSRLPLDNSWQGPPLDWPFVLAADFAARTERLQQATRDGLVRVGLSFRSPKGGNDPMNQRMRFRGNDEDEDGERGGGTERSVIGLLLSDNRVLVLANLKPRLTARLERITVFPSQGEPVAAKFSGSLKNFGALVATLDQPLPGTLKIADADLLRLRDQLLLRADVSIQGETRADYFHSDRISLCKVGARGRLYPELDEPQPKNAFLLTTNLEVVALPVVRREQVSGDRSSAFDRAEVKLTPARYLAEAVTGLPGSADASNVPVTEEEENRLAWLGVELQPLNRDLARANGVSDQTRDGETGALVTYVHPDSPAAKAGIPAGAVLLRLKVPGQALPVEVQIEEDYARAQAFPWDRLDEVPEQYFERIPTPWPPVENAFTRALTDLGFGTRYTAEFFIDGKLVAKELEVVAGPTHYAAAPRYKSEALGVTVRDQTYDVRRYLQRKPEDPGVVVARVEPGGKASVAGVKPYEIITHINDQPVNNVKDFEKLAAGGGEMKLSLKRMTKGRIVTIKANSN